MPISIGQTLGRYRIEEELGAGGMGVVYRAHDEKLERDLAIKVLAPGILHDEAARKRFRNEARILSKLNHPSIQTIYDFDTIEGNDLLISELVPGMSLDTRVRSGPVPEKEVLRFASQLAQGLAAAHAQGVLHRDLKPANLRVTPEGHLKILDFGLATLAHDEVLAISKTTDTLPESPSSVAGTLPYMPPEQLLGEAFDERSDIYSAGVALYELATGRLPFTHTLLPKLTNAILHEVPPSPRSMAPRLSGELDRIIVKCLEKEPEFRYQSAKELAADLRRMEAASARVLPPVASPNRIPRQRSMRGLVIGACAMLLVAAAVAWWRSGTASETSVSALRWEQVTNFNDSAQWPAISSDGKFLAFLRGPGDGFGGSVEHGEIWFKPLPDGDAIQLTNTRQRKITLAFSPDNTRILFTQVGEGFTWNTYEVALYGAQEPKLFMANATALSWIDRDHLLFSSIKTGIHMALETSNASRTDQRDIYVPADHVQGMVHRSALSPDGKWVLAVEMDIGWWERCRLVPFDGSNTGRQVGPEGECTSVAWSPDGKWMYFTVNTGDAGSHIWRQRFPDGHPQQLTPAGASEEEGVVVMPDGRSLITAAGTEDSQIWLHDDEYGDKQITSEGYAGLSALSPDGNHVYYLRRAGGKHAQFSGELWVADVDSGSAQRLFPGLLITHFAISPDGKKIVFASAQGQQRSGIWIAGLDGAQPPRQLTFGGEYRALFGRTGEIIYQSNEDPHLMSMNEDGTGSRRIADVNIMQLETVAPDRSWAVVGAIPPGSHGDRTNFAVAVPLNGGEPFTVCERCSFGFGAARMYAPLVLWSRDGKWLYVATRYFGEGRSGKTIAIPIPSGAAASILRSVGDEASLSKLPGARVISEPDVFPLNGPNRYIFLRTSAKTNLFRIYLQ